MTNRAKNKANDAAIEMQTSVVDQHRDATFQSLKGEWIVLNERKILIEGIDGVELRLVTEAGGEPLKLNTGKGHVPPTIDWLRKKFMRGEVRVMATPTDPETMHAFHELFDPMSVLEMNKRARALWHLATRARKNGTPIADPWVQNFLDHEFGVGPYDSDIAKPSSRTLMRAMAKVRDGAEIPDLVNRGGRKRGSTPFPTETDRLIHLAALSYWSIPKSTKADAYERLKLAVNKENSRLQRGATPHKLISKSAFYVRINDLECPDTVAAKFSSKEARKRFKGAGEPIIANYCFEYGYVDATRLENVIVFDENSRLPFLKPWVTAIMDVKSGAVLACHVHGGDPRRETTLQTLLLSLSPPANDVEPSDWAA